MKENKLIFLLKMLNVAEHKALKQFLNTHYGKYQAIQQLLQYLIPLATEPNLSPEKISDEKLFQVVWGKTGFDKGKISRLRYSAYQAVEDFLIHHIFEKDEYYKLWSLLVFYNNYQFDESYEKTLEDLQAFQEKQELRDANYYYHQFIIAESQARYLTQTQKKDSSLSFQNVDVFLNVFFVSKKLQIACTMLTRNLVLNTNYQPDLLGEVLQYIEENPEIQTYPSVAVYFSMFKMLKYSEETHYFLNCREVVELHQLAFENNEIRNIHSALRNYCISKINKGDKQFERELLSLYQQQLEAGWLLNEQGQLPAPIYKNVVVLALRLEQPEWTQSFLLAYQNLLPESQQSEAYHFCQAKLYFHLKQYSEILKLLNVVTFKDVFFEIDARKLLMQTYYELKEWEALDSTLNSFRVFLHRNKTISEAHKEGNRNFANFLKKIAFADNKKSEKEALTKELLQISPLAEKTWLMGKLIEKAENNG